MTPSEAYTRLADRCATTELSTREALDKLRLWGIARADAERIASRLRDERFIDDGRFARAFVRSHLRHSRWGLLKIRQALSLKGIDRAMASEAIDEEFDEEIYFGNLAAALRAKGRQMASPLGAADRQRLARFAASRGYEPSLIMEMIADEDYWRRAPGDDEPAD